MKSKNFLDSINNAAEGFIYAMKTERNMRIHFLLGIMVVMLGVYLNLRSVDILFLSGTISLVLICEMINTAVEHIVNMIEDEYHPVAKIIKDVSAGAVFVSAVNAIIIGYLVFSRNSQFRFDAAILKIKQSTWHLTFIAFILVLAIVVVAKTFFKKGTPFRGGMPSGHSAFAFSIWTIILFLAKDTIVIVLSFVMAVLIARHRIVKNVHNIWEIIAGSVLGVLVTTLIFQLLR